MPVVTIQLDKARVLPGLVALTLAVAVALGVHPAAEAAAGTPVAAPAPAATAVAFADTVLATWPEADRLRGGFEYNIGMVLHGIAEVYLQTRDARYLNWVRAFYDDYVDAQGNVRFNDAAQNLDYIQPGNGLIFLYEQTDDVRYATAARQVYDRLLAMPRNADGGFWHKDRYPNEMWADSIYMGGRFAAMYGKAFAVPAATDTAAAQALLFTSHAMPVGTNLPRHAWDYDRNAVWADRTTGLSPIVWNRATGWYAMSLVDQLSMMSSTDPHRAELLAALRRVAAGLAASQDAATGLWWQVLDQPTAAGNFLESSGSGFFVYALAEGVRLGYLDPAYQLTAATGWQGLTSRISPTADGGAAIGDAVEGMGVAASYAEYVNHRRLSNSPHGLMSVMLAATAMARAAASGPR
jgi:unsaturated rhamnogalacturonyl hydrolase